MKACLIALILLAPILVALGTFRNGPTTHASKTITRQKEDQTMLKARIKSYKARGERKAVFPGLKIWYEEVQDLDNALSRYSLVIARPVEKKSFMPDPFGIVTLYKLEVIKVLSSAKSTQCCPPPDLPIELPPLEENETLLLANGGTITLDEVEVTQEEEFGELALSQQYLIFLSGDTTQKVHRVSVGPYGVFRVMPTGALDSILRTPHILQREIEKSYGSSVDRLIDDLEHRQRQKNQVKR